MKTLLSSDMVYMPRSVLDTLKTRWDYALTDTDVAVLYRERQVVKRYLSAQVASLQVRLSNGQCRGKEQDVYCVIDALINMQQELDGFSERLFKKDAIQEMSLSESLTYSPDNAQESGNGQNETTI